MNREFKQSLHRRLKNREYYHKAQAADPERFRAYGRNTYRRKTPEAKIRISYKCERRRYWLNSYKVEKGCENCGYNKHGCALDFDHIDPSKKEFTIQSNGLSRPLKKIIEEVRKCRILCSNCHKIATFINHPRRIYRGPQSQELTDARRAWEGGAKGLSTFTNGGKREGILKESNGLTVNALRAIEISIPIDNNFGACYIDPSTGMKSCG